MKKEVEQIIDHVEMIMVLGAMAKSIQFWIFSPLAVAVVFFALVRSLRPLGAEVKRSLQRFGERAQIEAECV